jgi:hypothetical protein
MTDPVPERKPWDALLSGAARAARLPCPGGPAGPLTPSHLDHRSRRRRRCIPANAVSATPRGRPAPIDAASRQTRYRPSPAGGQRRPARHRCRRPWPRPVASSVQGRHPQRRRRGLFVETRLPTRPQPRRGDIKASVARDGAPDGAGKPIWDAGATKMPPLTGLGPPRNGQRAPKMPPRWGSRGIVGGGGYKDSAPPERRGPSRAPGNESVSDERAA